MHCKHMDLKVASKGVLFEAVRNQIALLQQENYDLREMLGQICAEAGINPQCCDNAQIVMQLKSALKSSRSAAFEEDQLTLKREIEKQDGELKKFKRFLSEFDEIEQENKELKLKVAEYSQMNEMLSGQVETMNEQMDALYSFMDIGENLDDPVLRPLEKSLMQVLGIESAAKDVGREIVQRVLGLKSAVNDGKKRESELQEQLREAMELLERAEEAMNCGDEKKVFVSTGSSPMELTQASDAPAVEQDELVTSAGEDLKERAQAKESKVLPGVASDEELKERQKELCGLLHCEPAELVKSVCELLESSSSHHGDFVESGEKLAKHVEKLVVESQRRKSHLQRIFAAVSDIFGRKVTRFSELCSVCKSSAQSLSAVREMCSSLRVDASPESLKAAIEELRDREQRFFLSARKFVHLSRVPSYDEVLVGIKKMHKKIRKLKRRRYTSDHNLRQEIESMKESLEKEQVMYSDFAESQLNRIQMITRQLKAQKTVTERILNTIRIHILCGDFSREAIANLLHTLESQTATSLEALDGQNAWSFSVDLETPEESLFKKRNSALLQQHSKYRMHVSTPGKGVSLRIHEIPNENIDFDPLFRQKTMTDPEGLTTLT